MTLAPVFESCQFWAVWGCVMVLWCGGCGEDVKRFIGTTSFVGTLCSCNGGEKVGEERSSHTPHPTTTIKPYI